MSFRILWLSRQLEHQNMSIISKDIDSQRKKWGVGWGGRGVGENPFEKEDKWNNLFKVCINLNFLDIETLVMKWCRQKINLRKYPGVSLTY